MTAFLQANNISKIFGPRKALNDVSLYVEKGEMLCLLGPSGCGKTTLLRIMAGLENADSGAVVLEGNDITGLSPEKRHIGFVFQNYALFPNLTVEANIAYGLHGPGYPAQVRKQRVQELLELVGLQSYSRRYPSELSGGQQQRVALARALAPDSKLLFMDEPLSALDAQVRTQLREDLRNIQKRIGITAVLVTHDQQEALAMSDRIVVMRDGRIEQVDTPEALYASPKTRFVAEFIGSMNIINMPGLNEGQTFGVRYEDVVIKPATEANLDPKDSLVGRIQSTRLLGAFYRIELLLSDQKSVVFADVSSAAFKPFMAELGNLVTVTLPIACWCRWEER